MKTIEIDTEIAEELTYDNASDESGWKTVTIIRGDEHRWYFEMTSIVTQDNETFYGFDWVDDKGEDGNIQPLEYTPEVDGKITAVEYKPVTRVIVEYVKV